MKNFNRDYSCTKKNKTTLFTANSKNMSISQDPRVRFGASLLLILKQGLKLLMQLGLHFSVMLMSTKFCKVKRFTFRVHEIQDCKRQESKGTRSAINFFDRDKLF